jgi:hypothetical protein
MEVSLHCLLSFCTRWRGAVSFTARPLCTLWAPVPVWTLCIEENMLCPCRVHGRRVCRLFTRASAEHESRRPMLYRYSQVPVMRSMCNCNTGLLHRPSHRKHLYDSRKLSVSFARLHRKAVINMRSQDVAVTLWDSVREVLGLNLGWDIGYSDCSLFTIFLSPSSQFPGSYLDKTTTASSQMSLGKADRCVVVWKG